MNIHWTEDVENDWEAARSELERAFVMSRTAAKAEESFVYVVNHDDLLGRRGAGNAMVATAFSRLRERRLSKGRAEAGPPTSLHMTTVQIELRSSNGRTGCSTRQV